jgi:hypothetical protein
MLASDPRPFEVEIAIARLKNCRLPCSDQIPSELIQAGDETLDLRSINSLILFGIRKNSLISGRILLLYQFTRRMIKLTLVIIVGYHCYQSHTKLYALLILLSMFIYRLNYWGSSMWVST